jgi:hypothetical protein
VKDVTMKMTKVVIVVVVDDVVVVVALQWNLLFLVGWQSYLRYVRKLDSWLKN